MSRPGTHNLSLYQGDYFEQKFALYESDEGATPTDYPVDITGWTGSAQIRDREGGNLVASFAVEILNGPLGELRIVLLPSEAVKVSKDGVWDLQMDPPNGQRKTWLKGKVKVTPEVTV